MLKNHQKKLKLYIKINKKIIKFHDTEIEKYKFHQHKSLISIDKIDINEMVVSFAKKDFKYFLVMVIFMFFQHFPEKARAYLIMGK